MGEERSLLKEKKTEIRRWREFIREIWRREFIKQQKWETKRVHKRQKFGGGEFIRQKLGKGESSIKNRNW